MWLLNTLHSAFSRILSWLNVLFGMAPRLTRLSPFTYRLIHYAIVIVVTAVLAWFSTSIVPESWLPTNPFVQRFYAAILFVLFYVFVRLLLFIINLFRTPEASEFEDIDDAWNAGLDALAREGLDIQWLPVFLVAGVTDENERFLFRSSRLEFKVIAPEPERTSAPLRFYVNEEALFIALADVGAMPRQLKKSPTGRRVAAAAPVRSEDVRDVPTLRHDQIAAAMQATARPSAVAAAPPPAMGATLLPSQRLGATLQPGAMLVPAAETPRATVPEKLTKEELDLNRRRLEYFLRLLAEERGEYCPINGLLQVLPLRWSVSQEYQSVFQAVTQDLKITFEKLRMTFPVVCVHAGLEEFTGLRELIERGGKLDPRFRDSRAGSRFPAGAPINEESSKWVIDRGLQWFRDWIYAEFAKDLSNPANRHLFQLICDLGERRNRLARELELVFGDLDTEMAPRLSGCYFSAAGPGAQSQAFVQGVLMRLISEQNEVSWTPERQQQDRRHRASAWLVTLAASLLTAVDLFLLWQVWKHWSI